MRKCCVLLLTLALFAGPIGAQTGLDYQRPSAVGPRTVAAPYSISASPAAGLSQVIDMVPIPDAWGVATDDVGGRVFVSALNSDVIETRDMADLGTLLNSFRSPGGTDTQTGLAYDPGSDLLYVIDMDALTLFAVSAADGSIALSNPIVLPDPESFLGGASFRTATSTIYVRDLALDVTYEFEVSGNLLNTIDDPLVDALPFLPGVFGNGVAVNNDLDVLDVLTGHGACSGPVPGDTGPNSILRQDFSGNTIAGSVGNLFPIYANPPTEVFPGGFAYSSSGSTGGPSYYIAGTVTDTVYETDAISSCAHAAITNHQCSLNGMEVTGTFDVNGADQVQILRNGDAIGVSATGDYMDTLPGPGIYTYTLVSVVDPGGMNEELCGTGQPCTVRVEILPDPAPVCPDPAQISLTQSADPATVLPANTVACQGFYPMAPPNFLFATGTLENSYLRHFRYDDAGITTTQTLDRVEIGVEACAPGPGLDALPLNLRIYGTDVDPSGGSFPFAALTLLHEQCYQIEPLTETLRCLEVDPPLDLDPDDFDAFVVEIALDSFSDCSSFFFLGSNSSGQSAPTFLASVPCGLPDPTDTANINFPNVHMVMNLYFKGGGGGNPFIRADSNGDGNFNGLVDGLFTLNAGFVPGSPQPPCLAAADSNGDRAFNALVDGLFTLNAAFVPLSPLPPAPFPDCGEDPNGVATFGCDDHACP